MVPKFQVTTACFSRSPKLRSLAVKITKIVYVSTEFEIKAPRPLSQATASNHPNAFTFTLLLPEGRAGCFSLLCVPYGSHNKGVSQLMSELVS
jgi:hypothetical protein